MKITKNKIFFWINDIDCILANKKPAGEIGGANVQMAFWATVFAAHNWEVYTTTYLLNNAGKKINGIRMVYFPLIRYVMFILYRFKICVLFFIRPDVVITRANPIDGALLKKLSKLLKFKIIHMLASDEDVEIKKHINPRFYNYLNGVDAIVAQNEFQREKYLLNFSNNTPFIPLIPNIWCKDLIQNGVNQIPIFDVLWVGNIRPVKRPEWIVELARNCPEFRFAVIGGNQDASLHDKCLKEAKDLNNILFLGHQTFDTTTQYISKAKVVVCTSFLEGFPNTFLQAWSFGIPVVSTVNPNKVITHYNLGKTAETIKDFEIALKELLTDELLYSETKANIEKYFNENHHPDIHFKQFEQLCLE